MARTLQKIFFGFLSTAGFVVAFALAGDVLMAAIAAVAIAVMQFVFARTTRTRPGLLMWVSLAVVIGLTALSMTGDDDFAEIVPPTAVNVTAPDCACSKLQDAPAKATPIPMLREAPKALAPEGSRV